MLQLKTIILGLTICMMFSFSQAQETKTVSKKSKNGNFTITENFTVLKENPNVKHGPYTASIFVYSENGQFEQGIKAGIWESFKNEQLTQKYDFSKQEFLQEDESNMIKSIYQLDETGTAVKDLGSRNIYFGGDAKMQQILIRCLRYPALAVKHNIEGIVIIEAILNKEGKIIEEKAVSKNGYGLEEEGIRALKLLPADWVPVLIDGKPVTVKFQFKVSFQSEPTAPLKN